MLKGETFSLQTFTSEAFALFIDRFANEQCGVMTGCALSNTGNSVTIGDGYFLIRGRLLRIISNVTVSSITTDGYYSLICEIDLSKTNTISEFNQGAIKVISGVSDYPSLTQQDITDDGTVYQYEFARFRVSSGSITDFADRRTYVNYGTILGLVSDELESLESQSGVKLKNEFAVLTGTVETNPAGAPESEQIGTLNINLPSGFTSSNSVVISQGYENNYVAGATGWQLKSEINDNSGKLEIEAFFGRSLGSTYDLPVKIVLMKIS